IFNIGRNTIYRWKTLKWETGDIKAKPYGPARGYNARINLKEFEELIESVGYRILFLPIYSPDLNPIEHYWFKIKNEIRKVTGQFKDISMAVEHVLKFI
ncbi:MAG: transposase, partial [Rickettsia endosymbiont of Ixodes persulcatus]|nr:transposase [Rickettsia endosymbiont of Ixodes persulcatus]